MNSAKSRSLLFLCGFLLGGSVGFLFASLFDFRGRVDWVAVGALASILVAVVAVIPIFFAEVRRFRQVRENQSHLLSLLTQINTMLGASSAGIYPPIVTLLDQASALPTDLLGKDQSGKVIDALAKVRVLVAVCEMLNISPGQVEQGYDQACTAVNEALAALSNG
jgi:hypothetical protein